MDKKAIQQRFYYLSTKIMRLTLSCRAIVERSKAVSAAGLSLVCFCDPIACRVVLVMCVLHIVAKGVASQSILAVGIDFCSLHQF